RVETLGPVDDRFGARRRFRFARRDIRAILDRSAGFRRIRARLRFGFNSTREPARRTSSKMPAELKVMLLWSKAAQPDIRVSRSITVCIEVGRKFSKHDLPILVGSGRAVQRAGANRSASAAPAR